VVAKRDNSSGRVAKPSPLMPGGIHGDANHSRPSRPSSHSIFRDGGAVGIGGSRRQTRSIAVAPLRWPLFIYPEPLNHHSFRHIPFPLWNRFTDDMTSQCWRSVGPSIGERPSHKLSLRNSDGSESIKSVAIVGVLGRAYAQSILDVLRCRGCSDRTAQLAFAGMGERSKCTKQFARV
jgi:hypothetical protein